MDEPQDDIRQQIDAILASVENDHGGQRPHTLIEVYVIEPAQDDARTVESTLDALIQEGQNDAEPETTRTPPPFAHRRMRLKWHNVALLTLL